MFAHIDGNTYNTVMAIIAGVLIVTGVGYGVYCNRTRVLYGPRPEFPRVIINHGTDVPDVTLEPANADVEVIMVDGEAEAQKILTYNGVSVYQCEKDCTLSDCWLATAPHTFWESEEAFDVRDLDSFEGYADLELKYESLFPGEHDKQILAYSIDLGHITEDGYRQVSHGQTN